MVTKYYKIYGLDGHRQRQSFGASETMDFRSCPYARNVVLEIQREDITGTNDYVGIRITAESAEACDEELSGQLSDGVLENCRVGRIEDFDKID